MSEKWLDWNKEVKKIKKQPDYFNDIFMKKILPVIDKSNPSAEEATNALVSMDDYRNHITGQGKVDYGEASIDYGEPDKDIAELLYLAGFIVSGRKQAEDRGQIEEYEKDRKKFDQKLREIQQKELKESKKYDEDYSLKNAFFDKDNDNKVEKNEIKQTIKEEMTPEEKAKIKGDIEEAVSNDDSKFKTPMGWNMPEVFTQVRENSKNKSPYDKVETAVGTIYRKPSKKGMKGLWDSMKEEGEKAAKELEEKGIQPLSLSDLD